MAPWHSHALRAAAALVLLSGCGTPSGPKPAELTDFEATADTLARLRKEAHKLTSAAGMLGFSTLSSACRELELAIDSGADAAGAFLRAREAKASASSRIEALIVA